MTIPFTGRVVGETTCRAISVAAIIVFLLMVAAGCSPERGGTPSVNQLPRVYIVNTPPEDAQFSRNPELNWYATDIDGYIKFFRYAVVLDTNLTIDGQSVDIQTFIQQATEQQFGWDTLWVDLDHPRSTATIRLYADTVDPENIFITQYFFVQAQDDQGGNSNIKYRSYSRNNHYPNTHFRGDDIYIDAVNADDIAPGLALEWGGADSTDWGKFEPFLEYEWRLYGPYLDTAKVYIDTLKEGIVVDPITGDTVSFLKVPFLRLDLLPPAVNEIPQPIVHSEGPDFDVDTNDVWVSEEQDTIYNVLGELNLQKTSKYKFIFWVRARDDGYVCDPIPAFGQFFVAKAKYEKEVLVLDNTNLKPAEVWHPRSLALLKSRFWTWINTYLETTFEGGYIPFDTISPTYPAIDTTSRDYFQSSLITAVLEKKKGPTYLDILSHKVLIYYCDDASTEKDKLSEDESFTPSLYFGLDMGCSVWIMARNMAGVIEQQDHEIDHTFYADFTNYFGITSVRDEGWEFWAMKSKGNPSGEGQCVWNEQFVGCYSLVPTIFPGIDIDVPAIDTLYTILDDTCFLPHSAPSIPDTHHFVALPEVGSCSKTTDAIPLYLYKSRFGESSPFHGKVMAVAKSSADYTRCVTMSFTPTAADQSQAQEMFNNVLPWLSYKFYTNNARMKNNLGAPTGSLQEDTRERRQRVGRYLRLLNDRAAADPEYARQQGVLLPPFCVSSQDW